MKESYLQKQIIDFLNKEGYFTVKIIRCNKNGFPDIQAFHIDKPDLFIEVKIKGKKPSDLQYYRLSELEKAGKIAFYTDSLPDFKNKYVQVLTN